MKKNNIDTAFIVHILEASLIVIIIGIIVGKVLLDKKIIDSNNKYITSPVDIVITDDKNGNTLLERNSIVKINANITNKTNNSYYYIWRTYIDGKINATTECRKLPKIYTPTLTINGIRQGEIVIYSDSKCKNKVQAVKTRYYKCSNCTGNFTIVYNSNGASGKMDNSIVTYGKDQELRKNTFTKNNYYFIGWRAQNKTKNKWLCYNDKTQTNTSWLDKGTCDKFGYYVYLDKQVVAKTGNPGDTIVMHAKWQYNYKSGLKGFSGFEKDPSSGDVKATIWPMINLVIYKNNNGTSSTGKIVPQGKALSVLDMTNKTNTKNSYVKISYSGTTGWINGEYVLINLPDVMPSAIYNITNASSSIFKSKKKNINKVTNKNLYGLNYSWYKYNPRLGYAEYIVPMRLPSAKKVQTAESNALRFGNKIKIYDAFRPWTIQKVVRDNLNENNFSGKTYCVTSKFDYRKNSNSGTTCLGEYKGWFIALKLSSHNVGKAVDVSLVSSDDNVEIRTQSAMHELSGTAVPTDSMINKYQGELALNTLFTNAGFNYLISEWWHFEDSNRPSVSGVEYLGADTKANHFELTK